MKNQSNNKLHSVQEVPGLFKTYFGYEIDFFDMLRTVQDVSRQCGSIATKAYLFKGKVVDYEMKLPCGVHNIKYVADSKPIGWYSPFVDNGCWMINYRVDQSGNLGIYNPNATNFDDLGPECCASLYEANKNAFDHVPAGRLVDFNNDDNCCLSFNFESGDVDVLYTGEAIDSDGYPKFPYKTIIAIAYNYHYFLIRQRYNKNQLDAGKLAIAKEEAIQKIANARTPDSISKNEKDDVFKVATDWSRKQYGFQRRK